MDINAYLAELDQLYLDSRHEKIGIDAIEKKLVDGLEQAEQEGDGHAAITIANELGGFYRVQRREMDAIPVFEKAMFYIRDLGLEGTQGHATTLLNYATMFSYAHNPQMATPLFVEAAAVFEQCGADPYRLASLHNNVATLYLQVGDIDEAFGASDSALECLAKCDYDHGDELGVTYTLRARIFQKKQEYARALAELDLAEAGFGSSGNPSPGHMAAMLQCRGAVLCAMGEFAAAEEALQKALKNISIVAGGSATEQTIKADLEAVQRAVAKHGDSAAVAADGAAPEA